jgi:V/A-type H+-transporting ATPase subunit I
LLKPEKLVRITIQVPAQFTSAATAILARFRLLHLIRIRETHLGRLGYVAETNGDLLKEFEGFFNEVNALLGGLEIPPEPVVLRELVIPEKEVFKVRERIGEAKMEVEPILNDLKIVDQKLIEKKTLLEKFNFLPADLDLSRLMGCEFVKWMAGLIPMRSIEKLKESLSEVNYAFIHIGTLEQRAVVLVFGLKEDWPIFERALKGAFFEKIDIPERVSGTAGEIIEDIHSQVAELEGKKKRLSLQREISRQKFGLELLVLKEEILAARNILLARGFFGKIENSNLISGWIPDRLFEVLKQELTEATQGQVIFEKVDPKDLREVREGIISIPILFNNPLLIRPFEKLTSLYGTPRYKEVEPTVFFALSFLLMFGMMFGDIGHGGVLFFLGYIVFRRFYKYMDYGIILMECGIFSLLFGFLYGSLFGLESVIPAVWFRPLDNISFFVKVTLIFGIALVSLGLALNFINALRLKEYEGLLSASGIAGALFYWLLVGLGIKYFLTGQLLQSELTVFGWAAGTLITIMVLHRPLYRLLFKKEHFGDVIKKKGFLTEIVESIIEFFDGIIRYLANTISFIRVAAFALAHAALFIAVFSIADLVAHEKGGGFFYWLVLLVGNIVIILLEGLVVFIQAVRLGYYEFFSKFFRGGGEKFRSFDKDMGSYERRL